MPVATRRRLRDELHVEAALEFVYKFEYQAAFGPAGSENELCHVYLGVIDGPIEPNEHEISAVRFILPGDLDKEFAASPAQFTPWFKMEWQALRDEHADRLATYCGL